MLDVPQTAGGEATLVAPVLLAALERASGAIARLDQALDNHKLLPAFLYRTRLEAVCRQAAVDGHGIDPWHLAAVVEGLRLRMDQALRIVDRGLVFKAARTALTLHQWITEPDFDQEGAVQAAERHLASAASGGLMSAADALWSWLHDGGTRPPIRAALIRFWVKRRLLRAPVPLTGPSNLRADAPDERLAWSAAFLDGLAAEADDYHDLLRTLEHCWHAARGKVAGQRCTSRAALAVLAAAPLVSATTLAAAIDMSVKCATELLDRFVAQEIAVEVTRRSKRRPFGLAGLAPLRHAGRPPDRAQPGCGRGRPPRGAEDNGTAPPLPPTASPVERRAFDYAPLGNGHGAARCRGQARTPPAQVDHHERRPRNIRCATQRRDPDGLEAYRRECRHRHALRGDELRRHGAA